MTTTRHYLYLPTYDQWLAALAPFSDDAGVTIISFDRVTVYPDPDAGLTAGHARATLARLHSYGVVPLRLSSASTVAFWADSELHQCHAAMGVETPITVLYEGPSDGDRRTWRFVQRFEHEGVEYMASRQERDNVPRPTGDPELDAKLVARMLARHRELTP